MFRPTVDEDEDVIGDPNVVLSPTVQRSLQKIRESQIAMAKAKIKERENKLIIEQSKKVEEPKIIVQEEEEDEDVKEVKTTSITEKISIKLRCGQEEYKVKIAPLDKYEKIFNYIAEKKGVDTSDVIVKFDGAEIKPNQRMDELEEDDLVDVFVKSSAAGINIHVRDGNEILKFVMKRSDKFEKLMKKIQEQKNKSVKLKFDGKILNPNSTFENEDMEDEDQIDLVYAK